jgi:hypothetical protein
MSAPAEAYRSTSIFVRNMANSSDLKTLIAILQVDKATMLDRFYLDGILGLALPDGTEGVVGYCRIGSVNYYMHAPPRLGSVAVADPASCVAMNDAGLNTLPFASTPVMFLDNFAGQVALQTQVFKSSYYSVSTEYGFYIRKNYGSPTKYKLGQNLIQNGVIAQEFTTTLTPVQYVDNLNKGDFGLVQVYIINEEGEYKTGEIGFLVNKGARIDGRRATWPSWACNNTNDAAPKTLYALSLPVLQGDKFFADDDCENPYMLASGFSAGGDWYQIDGDGFVLSRGICGGSYPNDDPASIRYRVVTYKYFETDAVNGCLFVGGGNQQPVTTYQSITNDKYYTSAAAAQGGGDGNYWPDGFLYVSTGANSMYYAIVNGVLDDTPQFCTF